MLIIQDSKEKKNLNNLKFFFLTRIWIILSIFNLGQRNISQLTSFGWLVSKQRSNYWTKGALVFLCCQGFLALLAHLWAPFLGFTAPSTPSSFLLLYAFQRRFLIKGIQLGPVILEDRALHLFACLEGVRGRSPIYSEENKSKM